MFTGNMKAIRNGKILEESLVPFVRACFPAGHRFQQDNDPAIHLPAFEIPQHLLVENTCRVS